MGRHKKSIELLHTSMTRLTFFMKVQSLHLYFGIQPDMEDIFHERTIIAHGFWNPAYMEDIFHERIIIAYGFWNLVSHFP